MKNVCAATGIQVRKSDIAYFLIGMALPPILLSAAVFAIPHVINTNAPIHILLMLSFAFGILACEMRRFTKSIWMSSAFHWIWNYSIVNVFIAINSNHLIYEWITIEILVLALLFFVLCKGNAQFSDQGVL